MQSDTTIPFRALQRPEQPGILDRVMTMGQLANMKQQRELNDQALRAGQRQEQGDIASQDRTRKVMEIIGQDLPLEEAVSALNQIDPNFAHTYATKHAEINEKLNQSRRQNLDLIRNLATRANMTEDPEQAAQIWQTGTTMLRQAGLSGFVDKLDAGLGGQPPTKQDFEGILGTLMDAEQQLQLAETGRHNRAVEQNAETTADEKNFRSFLPTYLEANGLQKNARTELQARSAFKKQSQNPTFQEEQAELIETAYGEQIGKTPEQMTATERVRAKTWFEGLSPKEKTDWQRRIEMFEQDPEKYNALMGRGGDEGPTGYQKAQLIQNIMGEMEYLDEAEREQYYERRRQMLQEIGITIPAYTQAQTETTSGGGSIFGGIAAAAGGQPQAPRSNRRYSLHQVIIGDDKKHYRIVGFAEDGEPLVEELKR